MSRNYSFDNAPGSFFNSLKEKVDQYFIEKKLDRAGNAKLFWKSIFQILFAAGLYTVLIFFNPGVLISVVLCVLLGLNFAIIGFNVMHEGGHKSFSRHPWMNSVSAYFLNVLGGNTYYWKIKHNVNHHTYTNVEGMDSDIDAKPFLRMHEGQPHHAFHRYQHIYWIVLYGISYVAWIFYEDFEKYFSGRINVNSPKKKLPLKEHIIFWISKALYLVVYVAVPIFMVGWLPWLIGFLIITSVCGIAISIVFQLAHVVEGTQFRQGLDPKDKQDWAMQQIASTSNFGTSSKLLHWLLGGLNFQIEHHLFPLVSHIHYPAISQMVKESCKEYNIVYHEYKSMAKAIVSHLIHLRRLGNLAPAT